MVSTSRTSEDPSWTTMRPFLALITFAAFFVMLVADGLGGLPLKPGGKTELETAKTPNLDALVDGGVKWLRGIANEVAEHTHVVDDVAAGLLEFGSFVERVQKLFAAHGRRYFGGARIRPAAIALPHAAERYTKARHNFVQNEQRSVFAAQLLQTQ